MLHVTDIIPPIGTPPDHWNGYSWFALWNEPARLPCDLELGEEVILVRPDGLATWRTEATDICTFPFEHVQSALEELSRRWSITPTYGGPVIAPGTLVAWRARPTGYVDRPVPDVAAIPALACSRCAGQELRDWIADLPAPRSKKDSE